MRRVMRWGVATALALVVLLTVPAVAAAQGGGLPDVVETIDGDRVRGTIVEERRDGTVLLQDFRGDVREFAATEIRYAGPAETGRGDTVRRPESVRLQINADWSRLQTFRQTAIGTGVARHSGGTSSVVHMAEYELLCVGSCTVDVPRSTATIHAMGRGNWPPVRVRPDRYPLSEDTVIDFEVRRRQAPRAVLGISGGAMLGTGLVLMMTNIDAETEEFQSGFIAGAVLMGLSIIPLTIWYALPDVAIGSARPMRDGE